MGVFRKGTLVECISDEHQRNVPIGTIGVVKNYSADGKLYTVRWFAYPR
jgi:hypothetical protein